MEKKDNVTFEFLKYITKSVLVEPVNLIKNILRSFLYPRAWFYAFVTMFILKIIWLRNDYPLVEKALIVGVIVTLVWKEYIKWYDNWIFERRKGYKKKAREETVKKHMKGK